MAQQRLDVPTSTIQPTPGTTPVDLQAEQALAQQQGKSAAATQQVADQVQTVATTVMRDETLKQAQRDAAQVVTTDDIEGKRGWGGFLYNETYTKAAVAQYSNLAVTEAQAEANRLVATNPNNPELVRTQLSKYLDEKKKVMPAYVADAMTPHYSGILAGAVSSATAGAARTNLASLEQTSKAALSGLILEQANTQSSTAYKNLSPIERQATDAIYADKWQKIREQMLGYMTAPALVQIEKDAYALVQANIKGREYEDRAKGMSMDPVGIAKLRVEADQWAKDPSRAQHYGPSKATLDGYIDRGANVAGAIQQAVLIDQHLKVGRIQDELAQLEVDQKDPAKRITDPKAYEARRKEIMDRAVQASVGGLPGQKAQLVAAAGDSGPAVQQMYGSAMLQASGKAMFGIDRATVLQGREEIKGMMQDEHFLRMAGNNLYVGGLYQQGQKILATSAMEGKVADVVQLGSALQQKEMTAKDLPQVFANAIQAGLVGHLEGQMSYPQFIAHASVGLAKNEEFKKDQATSMAALNDAQGTATSYPRPATETEVAAHNKVRPDKYFGKDENGRDKEVPFSPIPAHLNQGVATVVRANYMPDAVKNWIANLSPSSSPEDQAKAVNVYDQVSQVWAQKYAGLPDAIRDGKIYEATRKTMGDKATDNVAAFRRAPGNADAIAKLVATENAARNMPPGEGTSYTGALIGAVGREFDKGGPSLFTGAVMGAAKYIAGLNPSAQRGVEWLQSMKMFQNAGLAALTSALPQFGRTADMGTPKPDNIRIDPLALAVLDAQATGPTGYMTLHGNTWRDQGLNPHQQSFYRSLQDHPDMFSMVWSKDLNGDHHAVLTYRDYRAEYNQHHRQPGIAPWTDGEIRDADVSVLSARHPYIMGQANVDTGVYRTNTQPDGRTSWSISFQNKDLSKPPISLPVRPDDPLHDTLRLDLARNLAKRTEMDSFYKFISNVPGVALADSMVAQGRQKAMLQAASGRNGPGENWTALVDNIRAGFEVFTDQQIKAGNTNIQSIKPEDWAKLRRPEMQATINEMGSLYAIIFGSQPQLPLLGRGGSLEPGPPELVVPGPTSTSPLGTSIEADRAAIESRQQASPQTRRLIENSFRPPGTQPPPIPLGPPPPPPAPPPATPSTLPLVPPNVPPKR